jgi:hypothetical protein
MSKGYIVYEGISVLNNEPIVGIVVDRSTNTKTGNMHQLYILRSDKDPLDAVKDGSDSAICGSCVHRRSTGGACYVNLGHGPKAVYRKYKRGGYAKVSISDFKSLFGDKKIRFGAYGDPLALPLHILVSLKAVVKNNTSYTHQWKNSIIDGSSEMVSKFSSLEGSFDYFLKNLGISYHYDSISRGVLDTRDLIYFVSLTFFFLYLTHFQLEKRKV